MTDQSRWPWAGQRERRLPRVLNSEGPDNNDTSIFFIYDLAPCYSPVLVSGQCDSHEPFTKS
jgi:hypothetical protein